MKRRRLPVFGLALASLAVFAFAGTASAIEFDLPGERKGELHGFYELRLQFLGNNLPSNGITFSQFRHVLSLEVEAEIVPDRIGVLDVLTAFSRFVVTYECIYSRACGLMKHASSFGGDARDVERVPKNIRIGRQSPLFAGGTSFPLTNIPRTIQPVAQELNQNRRFRTLLNAPGQLTLINPVALLANPDIIARSRLDGPLDTFVGFGAESFKTRAGAFNTSFTPNLISAARGRLSDDAAAAIDREFQAGNQLSVGDRGELRELNRRIGSPDTSDADRAAAIERRDALLLPEIDGEVRPSLDFYMLDPSLQAAFRYPAVSGALSRNLMLTRPDPNRFATLASALAPQLLDALWAADKVAQGDYRYYLASLDTPIRPHGYFDSRGKAIEIVNNLAAGLASNVAKVSDANGVTLATSFGSRVVPLFVGPDNRANTADDLPMTRDAVAPGLTLSSEIPESTWNPPNTLVPPFREVAFVDGTVDLRTDNAGQEFATTNQPLILFGVVNEAALRPSGCSFLGGVLVDGVCRRDGDLVADREVISAGCSQTTRSNTEGGINQQGDCIKLNVGDGSPLKFANFLVQVPGVHIEVIPRLADPRFRPASATLEGADLTDFRGRAVRGRGPPARPSAPGGSLFFRTAGTDKFLRSTHHSVTHLETAFDEDELKWGHGANEDEHEFREGYLEFEFFDSEVFGRIGKLITVWGKTELFRNQDRLNPIDFSNDVVTKLEEARIGVWAIDVIYSPLWAMRVGPVEDLRVELAVIFDQFRGDDFGKCGENSSLVAACLVSFGAFAHGVTGLGLVGVDRPFETASGAGQFEYGLRFEGRLDRFTFAISNFWGWDDAFLLEPVFRYERRVDPETGAPVNAFGPLSCKVRPGGGGPDNDPTTVGDNEIPSVGNCLLFDNPSSADAAQQIRASSAIAANHSANQTLYHTICTLTFDADLGYCPTNITNNEPRGVGAVATILSGIPGAVSTVGMEGAETLRWKQQPATSPSFIENANVNDMIPFLMKRLPGGGSALPLTRTESALLGCGEAFASPCGGSDLTRFGRSAAYAKLLGVNQGELATVVGGIDFQNADASVLLQEFTTLKAFQPGAAVGTRSDLNGNSRYEAGITLAGEDVALATHGFSADQLLPMTIQQRAAVIRAQLEADGVIEPTDRLPPSDAWIEPMPWVVDPEAAGRGLLIFKVADQTKRDARCDGSVRPDGTPRPVEGGVPVFSDKEIRYCQNRERAWSPENASLVILNDPTDPTNPGNQFVIPFDGDEDDLFESPGTPSEALREWALRVSDVSEQCTPLINRPTALVTAGTLFDEGCTALETVSSNVERYLAAIESVGSDRAFDAPETVTELLNMLDGNFDNDIAGDPIAGPDGIYTKNLRVFKDTTQVDVHAAQFEQAQQVIAPSSIAEDFDFDGDGLGDGLTELDLGNLTMDRFFAGFNPESSCRFTQCHLQVGIAETHVALQGSQPRTRVQATSLPIAIRARLVSLDGSEEIDSRLVDPMINLLEIYERDRIAFARLWAGEDVLFDEFDLKYDRSSLGGQTVMRRQDVVLRLANTNELDENRDRDGWGVLDNDQDKDGVYDGLDDGSAGPVSDDNILCGTGLRGDILQDAVQYELYSDAEEARFASLFPGGFPERSPVGCSVANLLFSTTGQTLPMRRAGGDGTYGRRDFLWHGGSEVAITWEKRNVLSFGMDFAHDASGTSWGIEMSWVNNALILNSDSPTLTSKTDQYIISVSVDRPSFFNFLNPNRSLFLNLQVFMRYLTDYHGGRDDRNGNFAFVDGPFSGVAVFTFFTGYFQDRLEPRASIVWEPLTGNSLVLWQLGYRWTSSFTSMIRVNHFFGHEVSKQRDFFPFFLYPDSRQREAVLVPSTFGRFQSSVGNRDSLSFDIRYSW